MDEPIKAQRAGLDHERNLNFETGSKFETDRELWAKAAAGETESFGVIFDRHSRSVYRYCARRTSPDAADDLVSIVFLEAWRRRDEITLLESSALPWLLGVARRVMQHRTRTTIRHRRALERLPLPVIEPDHAVEIIARIDNRRQLAAVEEAFRRLNRIDQDVIALCVGQGLDYSSASVALGVPVGTVRSRLSRARSRLANLAASMPFPGDLDSQLPDSQSKETL